MIQLNSDEERNMKKYAMVISLLALQFTGGNKRRAAEILQIARSVLYKN